MLKWNFGLCQNEKHNKIVLRHKCCQCPGTRVEAEKCIKCFGCILDVRLTVLLSFMLVKRTV